MIYEGMREPRKTMGPYILAIVLCVAAVLGFQVYMEYFTSYLATGQIDEILENDADNVMQVEIQPSAVTPTGTITIRYWNGTVKRANVSDVAETEQTFRAAGFNCYILPAKGKNYFLAIYLPILLVGILVAGVITVLTHPRTDEAERRANVHLSGFGSSRAKMIRPEDLNTTFADVAGLYEEKEELQQVVDFLKNPSKYIELGAHIPKGLLLVGPPGNGKTLLAKAVAGEAGVPFFTISGSDFMEMFVGVGAARVRDMFAAAKEFNPCIIFIDEIDAVGRQRGTGMGGGHDEREQTLNQLLVEMDGFKTNSGIIVIAATNRADILDPALLRPGRFDRKIVVQRPDARARLEILNVHARKKPMGDDVNLENVARTTAGFTGADLANLLNEAALIAASEEARFIKQADIEEAFIKVGIGTEKRSRVISEKDRRITAFHEAGHALLFHLLPDLGPVHTISIIPTSTGAAGYTMPVPEQDEMFDSCDRMRQQIVVAFGGRVAEELVFGDVTTGASQDIKEATKLARAMVTQFGMSEVVGPVHYADSDEAVFIGRDLAHTRSYADATAADIDAEVKREIALAYAEAKRLLQEHMTQLTRCAELLIEKEKLGREEFEALF